MSIYLKDKALVPYHGDNRPLNVYHGGKKIAGYHDEERSGDGPHEWDDTYNDRTSGEIHGNGDLQSEYYSFERDSEQVQTVQGKNLFDLYRIFATAHVVDPYKCIDGAFANNNEVQPNDANIEIGNNELKVGSFVGGCGAGFYIPVTSGTTYTMIFDADVISTGSYLGYTFRKSNSDIVGTYEIVSNKTFTFTVP